MASSPLSTDGLARSPRESRLSGLVASARRQVPHLARVVTTPARALAFWTAIALPMLNLALLARGLSTPSETATFLGLLALNVLALLVGHPHRKQ